MKKLAIKVSKVFTYIFLILILLIALGVGIGKVYKEDIRNYIISEINEEIDVKVNVATAEFSVIKKFPFISVILTEVTALSGNEFDRNQFIGMQTDTLFSASRIYLQFNLIDILRKDYRLRRVHAVNGSFSILVDREGRTNYRIFKQRTNSNKENNLTIGLDGVKLNSFSWQFLNISKDIYSEGAVKEIALKGKFSRNNFSLNTSASLFIENFNREGIEYASGINLKTRLILSVNDSVYKIVRGDLSLNDLNFKTGGSFSTGDNTILSLQIAGENLNIKSIVTVLPIDMGSVKKYSPTGKADILAKISGEISSIKAPSIRAAFKFTEGKLFVPDLGSYLSGISLRGTYSNGSKQNASTSRLQLSEYSIKYGDNQLAGKLEVNNFINPFLAASVSGTIIAKDLSEFINIEGLKLVQGQINPSLNLNINLGSFKRINIGTISDKGINGLITFNEISGSIPGFEIPLYLLEGNISMEDQTWNPDFKILLGKNSFSASLSVNHFWDYYFHKSAIPEISGSIDAEYLSATDFLKKTTSSEETDFQLPDSIFLNLHCKADSFIYGKFLASEAETWFSYKPGLLSISSISMKTMKGTVSGGATLIADNQGQMLLRTSGLLKKLDINKLFYTFNNFGQDFIVANNLMGTASGTVNFSAQINPKLELVTKSVSAESDFVIENGELINFEPVNELSSFVELSELQHIKFSTLKNSVLIKDEKIYIPLMDINSSAFNLSISGTHGFDNYFEYKLRLNLNEILAGKVKKQKKVSDEFGVIEDDGTGRTNLYLSIVGTPDDFKIRYDKKETVNKIKSDLQEEKKLLKTILNEELGLFKKDSLSNIKNNSETDKFIMDWGDETDDVYEPEDKKQDKIKGKKIPDYEIVWDEENSDIK